MISSILRFKNFRVKNFSEQRWALHRTAKLGEIAFRFSSSAMKYKGTLCPHIRNPRSTPHRVELLSTNTEAPNGSNVSGQPNDRPLVSESAKRIAHNALALTSAITTASPTHVIRPEFFPRPVRGIDPFFGLSRWAYLEWERLGLLRLVRIRKPGHIRASAVLVPYDDVYALLRKLQNEGGCHE